MVGAILLSYGIGLQSNYGIVVLGKDALQGGFRAPTLPSPTGIGKLITPALLIAVLGFVESIVVVKHYGGKYGYPVSANRELVAFGVVNITGSLLNCYPTFASMARSQVNDAAGARTQVAGIVTALIILMTIIFFLPLFYWLPKCVMASIVLVAATGLLEFEDVSFLIRIRAWKGMARACVYVRYSLKRRFILISRPCRHLYDAPNIFCYHVLVGGR